ncbi:MAG: catalase [Anaerococcus vaginalis]|uniref:catalase n=1 Tax=Anaerococcus vaginalis TaxID=33037 RepID=UPI00288A0C4B|nr:catalase [Anaerococcus vaginalis]MDU4378529.1 catalase [Anaerococcus vaginalis]MDU5824180.1 catalase [Anaerococcus vaginalis]MDU7141908.1 catalase [Anaerococcus vaginalis]
MKKNPMDKNNLGDNLPSRNNTKGENPKITRASGAPVENNQDSMTAGRRGPIVFEDTWLFEKNAHFNREVIPERRMHAKGSGAFGTFTVTNDISKYTKAKIFSKVGKKTEMFARFSLVAGERGFADADRDIRGFALKFYTEEGNWDLVGNNTPVFFFRDPMKFIDLNRVVKRDPKNNMRSPNSNWDFWSSLPESLLQVTITMSDRGIPSSYRYMHGFGSHTYSLINEDNERTWVKFHFRSQQGIQNLTDQEAEKVKGMDPDSHQRDLFEAIEKKKYPKWKMYIQVMSEDEANNMEVNPFDLTKMWLKKDHPFIEVGEFELNKNPENYFQDVEQSAFSPGNNVPGISFSPDRMLQSRILMYGDAQRYRLGVNHNQIPVNSPKGMNKKDYHPWHRDGLMRIDGNLGGENHYEPNSYGNWEEDPKGYEPKQNGGDVYRYDYRKEDQDYYTQPGMLYRAMTDDQKEVLCENTARHMKDTTLQIKHRWINHCYQADKDYGERLAKVLEIDINDVNLELSKRDSRQANYKANNAHKELDKPSKDLSMKEWEEIKTDYDPKKFIKPEDDPYLL